MPRSPYTDEERKALGIPSDDETKRSCIKLIIIGILLIGLGCWGVGWLILRGLESLHG